MFVDPRNNPLSGLKVVELAGVLAGPSLGLFLAECGATVTKVENPATQGDMIRHWKVPTENPDASVSAYYASINAYKTILWADLNQPKALKEVKALIAEADVLITNFKPSSAHKLGLDVPTLSSQYPKLVIAEITAFGTERPGFDVVLQAESGFLHLTGELGRGPVKLPVALIDVLAGHQLKTGVLLALWQRHRTGKGGVVRVSLFDAAVSALVNQASNWLNAGYSPQRIGLLHPNIAPYGEVFNCADHLPIVVAVGTDAQFYSLCKVLHLDTLFDNKKFNSNPQRVKNRKPLAQLLQIEIGKVDQATLLHQLEMEGVPAGAIRNLPQVFADPATQRLLSDFDFEPNTTSKVLRSTVFEYFPSPLE